jgi:hypothetical protein
MLVLMWIGVLQVHRQVQQQILLMEQVLVMVLV